MIDEPLIKQLHRAPPAAGHILYAAYLAERKALLEAENDYAKSFDRWVITLSGGAIGLTIAFMNDFIADRAAVAKWAVVTATVALTLAIAAALASNFFAQNGPPRT